MSDGVRGMVGESEIDALRHALYELCVQSTKQVVPFLAAVHGGRARVLGEDCAGTAALSRRWVDDVRGGRAVAVDLDAGALGYSNGDDRIERVAGDVMACTTPADIVFVGNFSIGYWHTRSELVAYLRHARGRIAASGGGVFVCDTYGGETAFVTGEVHRDHRLAGDGLPAVLAPHRGGRVRYTWEQRDADPSTGMVTNACHFRLIGAGGMIGFELEDAFVYRWRLWSIPELRDALTDAGFGGVDVYSKTADAVDQDGQVYVRPIDDGGEELDGSFIVHVVGRV